MLDNSTLAPLAWMAALVSRRSLPATHATHDSEKTEETTARNIRAAFRRQVRESARRQYALGEPLSAALREYVRDLAARGRTREQVLMVIHSTLAEATPEDSPAHGARGLERTWRRYSAWRERLVQLADAECGC